MAFLAVKRAWEWKEMKEGMGPRFTGDINGELWRLFRRKSQ